ncbi:hypothetical protein [Nocardiopsis sp. CNT312]|uniref:hypothetical protein n=1 Tax=Nocardiopsis sp. CNT312 TaxID=1137268 RepID=UPI00048F8124|nr:hypothetical protein [Nocardiopsis sp. CNT312]
MSTYMIEPGAKLADRYRLDHVVSETSGATRWKATDETLARPVGVWTFQPGFPRASEVVRAARATSRIPDARVTQVFDADDTAPLPYVVEEWVIGSSLADLIAQGPLEPERAAGLVAEAAEAIAAAHAGGLYHLCLSPGKLMWSSGGAVKVTGIGVDAALVGAQAANPAAADAQGLGNLLYAALTGYWPGGARDGLPAAPEGPGGPYQPEQITPNATEPLASITTRAAMPYLAGHLVPGPPIASPAEFSAAMADVPRFIPLPATPTEAIPEPEPGTSRRTGELESGPRRSGRSASGPRASERRPPARAQARSERPQDPLRKIITGVVAAAVFLVVVVGAWIIGTEMRPGGGDQPDTEQSPEASDGPELQALTPVGADGFDPFGDGSEHGDNAVRAIDGEDSGEPWNSEGYDDPLADLGKPGVGLIVDLGSSQEVHEVVLSMPSNDYPVQIRVGEDPASVTDQASLDAALPVAAEATASGPGNTVTIEGGAAGRYVLVWFTQPPMDGDKYRAALTEIEILGAG